MSETGHARNVQHFQEMVTFYAGWGASYNPSNTAIDLRHMQAKLTGANAVMDFVCDGVCAAFKDSQNDRENTYSGIRKHDRDGQYYASTGTDENRVR